MSCSEAKGGEYNDGIPCPTFPESTSIASRCVANLKFPPQVEAQENRPFFTERLGLCFILLSVQCPGCGSLSRTDSLIVSVLSGPETKAPLATRGR